MGGEQPPVLPAEENRDLLLLPMTTPPVADGITEPVNPEGMPKEEVALYQPFCRVMIARMNKSSKSLGRNSAGAAACVQQ